MVQICAGRYAQNHFANVQFLHSFFVMCDLLCLLCDNRELLILSTSGNC
jgi:hypothetical protein